MGDRRKWRVVHPHDSDVFGHSPSPSGRGRQERYRDVVVVTDDTDARQVERIDRREGILRVDGQAQDRGRGQAALQADLAHALLAALSEWVLAGILQVGEGQARVSAIDQVFGLQYADSDVGVIALGRLGCRVERFHAPACQQVEFGA